MNEKILEDSKKDGKERKKKKNETFSFLLLLFTALWAAGDTEDPLDFLG